MFGRVELCDFVLEHPTISRFHAGKDFYSFVFMVQFCVLSSLSSWSVLCHIFKSYWPEGDIL